MTDDKLKRAKELKNEIEATEYRIKKVDVVYHPLYYSSNLTITSCGAYGNECSKVHEFNLTDEEAVEMLNIIRRRGEADKLKLAELIKEYEEL